VPEEITKHRRNLPTASIANIYALGVGSVNAMSSSDCSKIKFQLVQTKTDEAMTLAIFVTGRQMARSATDSDKDSP